MLHVDRSELARDCTPLEPDALASVGPALAAAGIGVFQIDAATGLATWDAITSVILGLPPVPQREPAPLPIHPDHREDVARRIARNVRGEGERDVEVRIVRPSGEIRWVRSTTRLPEGEERGRRWLTGVVTDITERKTAELGLIESRRQLATLIDNLPGIAYRCSVEAPWTMSFISEGVEALTGYSAADFIEGGLGWADLIDGDGGAVGIEVDAAVAERRMFTFTYRIVTRSGEIRWVLEQGRAIYGDNGEPLFLEGFIGDVTERKRTEAEALATSQRLGSVLEGTLDCVYSMDRDFRITYFNENARRQFNRPKLLGKRIREVLPGSEVSQFAECYRRVMETRKSESIEGFFPPDDAWYEAHVTPSDDGITIFYRDITARKDAEEALRQATARAHSILDSVPHIIWSADAGGRIDYLSNQWRGVTVSTEALLGGGWIEAVHPDDRARAQAAWKESVATGEPYEIEMRGGTPDDWRWLLVRAVPERSEDGAIARWYGTCTDIHDRIVAQQKLSKTQGFLERLVAASPDNIMLLDGEGRLLFSNEAAQKSLGVRTGEPMAGRQWAGLASREGRSAARDALAAARDGRPARFTARLALPGQAPRWWDVSVTPLRDDDAAAAPDLLVISRDVTVQKEAEEQAHWSARHDFLTRLPNRHFLQQRLDAALARGKAEGEGFALLLLDVDQFKSVNDNLGHDAGDALLCGIAERLTAAARPEDTVARLGGDEFAILLEGVATEAEVEAVLARVVKKLGPPCLYQGKTIDCHASIGASLYPVHGQDKADLLKHADTALYAAKAAAGRGHWKLYDPELRAEVQKRQSMISLARNAVANDLIVPHYQPKVDLRSGRLAGFEALLRWSLPGRTVQSPDTISAAFEDLALATEISDRMIGSVLRDMREWLDCGVHFDSVAINAAAAEFRRSDFAERLLERIQRCGIPPFLVQLEVTETVFLGRGAEHVERCLQTLSAGGVRIALDDFGTGYASLSHLKQFPVDLIKIDRSFVAGLLDDGDDRAIVDAVINLGQSLGIDVVAEGIETPAQREALLSLGCAYGQGYYFGHPEPAERIRGVIDAIAREAARHAA